jgi:acetyl-CoA synthetase
MARLNEYSSYKEVIKKFKWNMLWDLFDGNEKSLNIAHECIDRHVDKGTAIRIKFADGRTEKYTFKELSEWTSRFANFLKNNGVDAGDRVGVMLEPSLEFYMCLFGAIKRGAIAIPLFTLFGSDALEKRVNDCKPKVLVIKPEKAYLAKQFSGLQVYIANPDFLVNVKKESFLYEPQTSSNDPAIFQYTSGTTREFPEAVKHTHRSVVTLILAALFGLGLRDGDRYFCPSSPAWGHGLWHGSISPWCLGISAGTYSGKFDEKRILEALSEFKITNFAAAATVYRMLKNSGLTDQYEYKIEKLSFTGEPIDSATYDFIEQKFGVPVCSMYGTTETGVILANYPGFKDFVMKPGCLGKPVPGWKVAIIDKEENEVPVGTVGEIALKRQRKWFYLKDAGFMDKDGYFWYKGRSDDVIISAGWTISALEVEDALLKHQDIQEAAVIGVPDEARGLVVKAYLISKRNGQGFEQELKEFVKKRLSAHEFPRVIEFMDELPKTPAGKVNRNALKADYGAGKD